MTLPAVWLRPPGHRFVPYHSMPLATVDLVVPHDQLRWTVNQPALPIPDRCIFVRGCARLCVHWRRPNSPFVLLIVLAAVLVWATLLEAARGREYSQWYVYDSRWFLMLLGLLGVNIFAATLARLPWKRRSWKREQIGSLITHVGLLVLLAGAVQTYVGGVQGELVLAEGKDANEFVVTSHSVIKIVHSNGRAENLDGAVLCSRTG